jgi:hypothetical protein
MDLMPLEEADGVGSLSQKSNWNSDARPGCRIQKWNPGPESESLAERSGEMDKDEK